jgi:SCP-2 sterol transfer family
MKLSMPQLFNTIAIVVLGAVLVFSIWQPVFPSGWIIEGMAQQIDPGELSLDESKVLRFELAGKGGGEYNLAISEDVVEVYEGKTHQADLIIAMEATDFNHLIFQLAQGKADEFTFAKLAISNTMKFAGDMSILELLNPEEKGKK